MSSPLRQIADIISQSVDAIDTIFKKNGHAYPTLNDLFNPASPAEGLTLQPEVLGPAMAIIAATDQLTAIVKPAFLTLFQMGLSVRPQVSRSGEELITMLRAT